MTFLAGIHNVLCVLESVRRGLHMLKERNNGQVHHGAFLVGVLEEGLYV